VALVKDIVATNTANKTIVIVSALGGVTDTLLNAANLASKQDSTYKKMVSEIELRHLETIKTLIPVNAQSSILSKIKSELNTLEDLLEGAFLIGEITPQLSDKIVSYGEMLSSYIISEYFKQQQLDATHVDSRILITTNEVNEKAAVNFKITNTNCQKFFSEVPHKICVAAGFIASSETGNPTTLGRGGSDYTAAIIASAVDAEELQIWTDVSGMYTANPKLVKQAKAIPHISYEEAMELSHFGAKVLYPPTIQPVLAKGISIVIKNTFSPEDPGTLITKSQNEKGKTVRGISHVENIALLSLEGSGMVGIPGISKRFFEVLSQAEISVVLITQASSEHSICVGLSADDIDKAVQIVNTAFEYEIERGKIKSVVAEKNLAIIALVGDNMKSHQGLSGKMFSTLGKNNVNITQSFCNGRR